MRNILASLLVGSLVACSSDSDPAATDARTEALSYAKDDLACSSEADCCVVFDGCRGKGLIVAAKDQSKVAELIAAAPHDRCVLCIPPWVQIKCLSSKCSAVALTPGSSADINAGQPFAQNHCGALALPSGWTEPQSLPEKVAPGLQPAKVLGCGD